ncbi:hypothetical protein KDU71_21590 [Carboxylicivirga sediminis]|uniref:Uncharacterized protein n=1 Tax=Carboxylicivirga sediminis TaxID=2006564 RepID=A0A941F832_9BACT|nr:hypothetical protein [Carboxylicivirga sediminis]MBR8538179.1 hypothetical protein [Carboxylicivirga sediminis]
MSDSRNQISMVMAEEAKAQIIDLLKQITDLMPFLTGLTPEQRKRLPKIEKRNKTFVKDVEAVIKNDASLLPSYVKPDEMAKDLELYEQLEELLTPLGYLYDRVRDTQMLAGSEAYTQALMVYNMIKAANKAGLPGANSLYNQLKGRFDRSSAVSTDEISNN